MKTIKKRECHSFRNYVPHSKWGKVSQKKTTEDEEEDIRMFRLSSSVNHACEKYLRSVGQGTVSFTGRTFNFRRNR
jgi:hypothetical protein